MKLKSIPAEAKACRAAWAAMPDSKAGVHIHHETPVETLTEPIEYRIVYILSDKPKAEQALRLHLMRPVTAAAWAEYDRVTAAAWAEYDRVRAAAWAEYDRVRAPAWAEYDRVTAPAHKAICPTTDCPWDGRTIFPVATR